MKTILVTTDFSDTAQNAVSYAAALAIDTNAELHIYSAFQVPLPVGDMPMVIIPVEEIESATLARLTSIAEDLKKNYPTLHINNYTTYNDAVDGVVEMNQQIKPDLVVMGIDNDSILGNAILGSTSMGVIKKRNVPVLLIPAHIKYTKPTTIALAVDFDLEQPQPQLEVLRNLATALNCRLLIINNVKAVAGAGEHIVDKAELDLLQYFDAAGIHHSSHQTHYDNVTEGILQFTADQNADIIAMTHHKHTWDELLFTSSKTKKVAFNTNVPLLAIPEKREI